MATTPAKKIGRPFLNLDEDKIFELAKIQCTNEEIAAVMKCSKDTIENRYSAIVKKGKEAGKKSLRRIQWAMAQKSTAMAIWLGKQYLGQRDMPIEGEADQKKRLDQVAKLAEVINAKKV
jgi:23S rRNA maturation mini-RNase III